MSEGSGLSDFLLTSQTFLKPFRGQGVPNSPRVFETFPGFRVLGSAYGGRDPKNWLRNDKVLFFCSFALCRSLSTRYGHLGPCKFGLDFPMTYSRPQRTEIAAMFAICDCNTHRGPQKSQRFPRQGTAMLHCDLRARWKVASDFCDFGLRFLSPKPLLSAGFLATWLRQRGNR